MSNEDLSRRDALTGGAAALAGVSVAMAVTAAPRDAEAQNAADAMALNGLLAAEYNAIAAYTAALPMLAMDPMYAAAAAVGTHFKEQHTQHAAKLVPLVMAAGGTPVTAPLGFQPPAGFNVTPANILKLACNAEKHAAISYTNALKTISSKTFATVVAAIGGVETQHFIVLYLLVKGIVTPGAMAGTMINEIVPKSFVAAPDAPGDSLSSQSDIPFSTM